MSNSKLERNDESKKRVLAPGTPSPRKRKRVEDDKEAKNAAMTVRRPELPPAHIPRASGLLATITTGHFAPLEGNIEDNGHQVNFTVSGARTNRDAQTLALVEKLEIGPYSYKPPVHDPKFEELEPHSGIRLEKRTTSHEDVYELMRGRYYLSPAVLYSIARPSRSRQEYEVPVEGEWVVIAVVAERGDVKVSQRSISQTEEEGVTNAESISQKNGPKKYATIRLVDLGGSSFDTKGKAVRGDAQLNMILFEADQVTTTRDEPSSRAVKRAYKGGSGGAFEQFSSYMEGNVIAICSPKVLKPYQTQRSGAGSNSVTNLLGITPTSSTSILVIGKSRDLGHCAATRKDGSPCGNWCDKRIAHACDWHVQQAVQSRRASRAEFSVGTSGMSNGFTRRSNSNSKFNPSRKSGLLPQGAQAVPTESRNLSGDTGAMYVIGSEVVRSSRRTSKNDYLTEDIGRENQEKNKRRREREDGELRLSRLFTRKGPDAHGDHVVPVGGPSDIPPRPAKVFSAEALKRIGFDPTVVNHMGVKQKVGDEEIRRKLDALENLHKPRKNIYLGKPPLATRSSVHSIASGMHEQSPPPPTTEEEDSDLEIEG